MTVKKTVTGLLTWRWDHGLTQAEAAKRLGFNMSIYGLLESGRLRPNRQQIERLRNHFGADTSSMLTPIGRRKEAVTK